MNNQTELDELLILAKTFSGCFTFTIDNGVFSAYRGNVNDDGNTPIFTGGFNDIVEELLKLEPERDAKLLTILDQYVRWYHPNP